MKKQLIIGSLIAISAISYSQNSSPWPSTGNVGIGTNSPQQLLDIRTTIPADGVKITQSGTQGACGLQLNNTTSAPQNVGRNWGLFSLGVGDAGLAGNLAIYDLTSGINRFFIDGKNGTGNVGIGTMLPGAKLDVFGAQMGLNVGDKSNYFQVGSVSGSNTDYLKIYDKRYAAGSTWQGTELRIQKSVDATDKHYISFKGGQTNSSLNFGYANTDLFSILDDGKTQITSLNTTPFRVFSNGTYAFEFMQTGQNPTMWVENLTQTYGFGMDVAGVGHIYNGISAGNVPTNKIINYKFDPTYAAQVWIGDVKPQTPHADFKLAVAGKMVAQSLYITASGSPNWADYVFANDYKVPNLYDIEKYYLANKHLPEIPSTEEVKENGINVGEMNALLLKKIEEMTIIMVKQQRQIDELENKIK